MKQGEKEMTDWQPIETAPKDGTWLLVGEHRYAHPFVARWTEHPTGGYWQQDNQGVWDDDMGYWQPTHWQPLPVPPTP
jgi:hypothetical protein